MKRLAYSVAGLTVVVVAGLMIVQALSSSLVYFILPSEYEAHASDYEARRFRLGGFVEAGSVRFDSHNLLLSFNITDSVKTYPVEHRGTAPEMFREGMGVVVEGNFHGGVFAGDNLLVKHSEVYEAPKDGEPVDIEALRESLR
ncbi:cytochrome c maturation protein CcmE [soil metagenome]|nr:cytochrome c maturation protein CcmE [Deinococcota bacterium]